MRDTFAARQLDPDTRAEREARALEDRVRRQRVEILGLPVCRICEGTTDETAEAALRCVCAQRQSALQSRAWRMLHEHTSTADDRGARVAP